MNKILVYGATGDQGLPLIDELLKNGYKVRAVSRNPDDFKAYGPSDVEPVKADLFDIDSLRVVSKDVDACLLYTSPSPRDGLLSRMPSSA